MVSTMLVLWVFTCLRFTDPTTGKVVRVEDGNTLEVSAATGDQYRIVLLGIDCPELSQDFGPQSRDFLKDRTLNEEVVVSFHGKDRMGNRIGIIVLKDGTDIRHELLKNGLAWTTEKNPIAELEALRLEAEQKREGLWGADNPTPPWVYRRQQSMVGPKSN